MIRDISKRAAGLAMGVCAAALAVGTAQAATVSGELNGLSWTATSTIVGQTATGTPGAPRMGGGGTATYLPDPPKHSGTAAIIMDYGAGGRFICSGSLVGGGKSIVTAGHCVSGGGGVPDAGLLSTTAYFWDYSSQADERVPLNVAAVAIDVTDITVHQDYTGEVIDQNDIAVLRLADFAPDFAQVYQLHTEGDLTGKDFNVAGYGARSLIGGAQGADPVLPSTGHLREGDNRYDFRWGDDDWGGFFDGGPGGFFGTADTEFSYVSDFDNGVAINDASCRLAVLFGLGGGKYCNTGLGEREVGIAGGDSGGPGFINGKLASVNSYGLTFTGLGDFNPGLNSSWGEFSGYVPIFIHEDFIKGAVPEPGAWALMIGGFGLAGSALRRRRLAEVEA